MIHAKEFSLTELDSMTPFEREIYGNLLMERLEKEKQEYEKQMGKHNL